MKRCGILTVGVSKWIGARNYGSGCWLFGRKPLFLSNLNKNPLSM
jgi:hypothetical protein